jgi:hypothetical protein
LPIFGALIQINAAAASLHTILAGNGPDAVQSEIPNK